MMSHTQDVIQFLMAGYMALKIDNMIVQHRDPSFASRIFLDNRTGHRISNRHVSPIDADISKPVLTNG